MNMTSREMVSHFKENYPGAIVLEYCPGINTLGWIVNGGGVTLRMANGDIIHYFPTGFPMPKKKDVMNRVAEELDKQILYGDKNGNA